MMWACLTGEWRVALLLFFVIPKRPVTYPFIQPSALSIDIHYIRACGSVTFSCHSPGIPVAEHRPGGHN